LRWVGATKADSDFRPYLTQLPDKTNAEMTTYEDYAINGSLLFGDMGTALLIMGLAPTSRAGHFPHLDAPFTSPELETLIIEGGRFTQAEVRSPRGPIFVMALAAMGTRSSSFIDELQT
jgi:hypothetical protein